MKEATIIKRIAYLQGMLSKYSDCWGANPSRRMLNWVDELNGIRDDHYTVYRQYFIDNHGWTEENIRQLGLPDAYDSLA